MLEIVNLSKHYGDFSLNCSLSVKAGHITGLVGQNGAGKSTTFKAILGLISADGGTIEIFGKNTSEFTPSDKEALGVTLSDSGFSGYLTVKDIIPILDSLYKNFEKTKFMEYLNRFGLQKDKKIKDFSTGMKAKLKLLVAISHGAKLLILDEPTTGLDVVARDEILLLLREYMEECEDRAILISSHISSDLESLTDDIYMLHEGEILLHEDTDRILSEFATLKMSEAEYDLLDKNYILAVKKEPYGITALTDQRRFYSENYPNIVMERGSVDTVTTMMIKGVRP